MAATHRVGFRHFTFGEWREPGTLVDASDWPNRLVLEESGYLHPLSSDERVALQTVAEAPALRAPKVEPMRPKGNKRGRST